MLKKHNIKDEKILKSTVGFWSVYPNINVIFVFYIKYSVNIFPNDTTWDVKNKNKNLETMKSYSLNIL